MPDVATPAKRCARCQTCAGCPAAGRWASPGAALSSPASLGLRGRAPLASAPAPYPAPQMANPAPPHAEFSDCL